MSLQGVIPAHAGVILLLLCWTQALGCNTRTRGGDPRLEGALFTLARNTRTRGGDPGESMNKIIPNNSVIGIIEYDSVYDLKNGDIVVHSTQDSECAVKYFYRDGNKLIFRPYSTNPNYYDTIFDINDNVKIIGKVVQYSVTL